MSLCAQKARIKLQINPNPKANARKNANVIAIVTVKNNLDQSLPKTT